VTVSKRSSSSRSSQPTYLRGLLDTCAVVDLPKLAAAQRLPAEAAVSAITLAELAQGVAMAKDPTDIMARSQLLSEIESRFDPLPFDAGAARSYGTLVAATVAAKRNPRPRRVDLMIAAVAAANDLPLFTSNVDDFRHLGERLTVVAY